MEIIDFEVGKKFPIPKVVNHVKNGHGGASFDYIKETEQLQVYIGLPKPRSSEVRDFRNGVIRFALYPNHILNTSLILVSMGKDLVFDLLYDINVMDLDMEGSVKGNRLDLYLIDSETGILKAIRTIGLGPVFMEELNKITKNDSRYTTEEYQSWINSLNKFDIYTLFRMSNRIDWDK